MIQFSTLCITQEIQQEHPILKFDLLRGGTFKSRRCNLHEDLHTWALSHSPPGNHKHESMHLQAISASFSWFLMWLAAYAQARPDQRYANKSKNVTWTDRNPNAYCDREGIHTVYLRVNGEDTLVGHGSASPPPNPSPPRRGAPPPPWASRTQLAHRAVSVEPLASHGACPGAGRDRRVAEKTKIKKRVTEKKNLWANFGRKGRVSAKRERPKKCTSAVILRRKRVRERRFRS